MEKWLGPLPGTKPEDITEGVVLEWECGVLVREDEEEKKKEDMQKVNIDPKDLEFHLNLELLCFIEGTSSVKHCRVHINDTIGVVVDAA